MENHFFRVCMYFLRVQIALKSANHPPPPPQENVWKKLALFGQVEIFGFSCLQLQALAIISLLLVINEQYRIFLFFKT